MENKEITPIIDNVDSLLAKMKAMKKAQEIFATYSQEQVDKIFFEAAIAAIGEYEEDIRTAEGQTH